MCVCTSCTWGVPQDPGSKVNVRELTRETQPISAVHVHAACFDYLTSWMCD